MAIPDYPSTLPKPSMGNYSLKPQSGKIRTEMEGGPARVRRRSLSVPVDVQVLFKFDRKEFGIFQKFYREDLFDGASYFNIKLVNGAGEHIVKARFKDEYEASVDKHENFWQVSGTLEAMNMPLIS
ncbi:hypothetical protein [Methylobacillus sp.]|uniref:hypothetical protein n=1 Tax=Methylobacillus sp. TaxID=56818 RepID=UPI0012BD9095|nr:hypothetical protein [Methylobacillus sp.]MPS48552.1 hypothetical protein [Methylobacillus sp.]